SSIISDHNLSVTLLHPIADESFIEPVAIEKRISPSKLVEASGIDAVELRKLNPALRNLNNPLPDGYHLLVPKHQAQLVSMTVNTMSEESFQSLEKHLIKNGESLSGIARQYGTSIAAIQEANNLAGNKIVAGRTLFIPPYSKNRKPIAVATAQPTNKKMLTPQSKRNDAPYFYVVAMGDSFWKIASRNNTTVDRLAIINDRSPSQPLRPGESILID
ncbi:MAG: LysM peptidoglycan-binding domain-containing protein, partial [Gammaproteobacteria bacterium]